MRAFESGKDFAEAFRDVLKNTFNTLVLKPIIEFAIKPIEEELKKILDELNLPGKGGTGKGSIPEPIKAVLGTAIRGYANYELANAISGEFVLAKELNAVGAALSMIPGVGPIAAIVAGLLNRAFGMAPKKITASGIEGSIGGGEVNARQFADWKKKGGWFRKSKYGTDYSPISDEMSESLDVSARLIYNQSQLFAQVLGLSQSSLSNVMTQVRVTLTEDSAANEKAIQEVFMRYRDDLATSLGDALKPFQKAAEAIGDTLERLGRLSIFQQAINQLGGVFSRVAQLSLNAKEELLAFAGGIDAFLQRTGAFVESYYSQEEQFGLQAREIRAALNAAGVTANVGTKEEFRRLVESTDVSTKEGRERLVALLEIAEIFAPVADYLVEQGKTLDELVLAAPQVAVLKSILEDQETLDAWQKGQGQREQEWQDWYRDWEHRRIHRRIRLLILLQTH